MQNSCNDTLKLKSLEYMECIVDTWRYMECIALREKDDDEFSTENFYKQNNVFIHYMKTRRNSNDSQTRLVFKEKEVKPESLLDDFIELKYPDKNSIKQTKASCRSPLKKRPRTQTREISSTIEDMLTLYRRNRDDYIWR